MPASSDEDADLQVQGTFAMDDASVNTNDSDDNDTTNEPSTAPQQDLADDGGITDHDIRGNDVLLGRGGKNNRHVGNEQLRNLARDQVERYIGSAKKIKSSISRELVQTVRDMQPAGRFLKRIPKSNGHWKDVGDDMAREKVSQVLRDAVGEVAESEKPSHKTPEIEPKMTASSSSTTAPPEEMHRLPIGSLQFSSSIDTLNIDSSFSQEALDPLGQATASTAETGFPTGIQQRYHPPHPQTYPSYHQDPCANHPPQFFPTWGYRSLHGELQPPPGHVGPHWPVHQPYGYASYPPYYHQHPAHYPDSYESSMVGQTSFDREHHSDHYHPPPPPHLQTSPINSAHRETPQNQSSSAATPVSTPIVRFDVDVREVAQSSEANASSTHHSASPHQTRRTKRGRYQRPQESLRPSPIDSTTTPQQHSPFATSARPYATAPDRSDYAQPPPSQTFASAIPSRQPHAEAQRRQFAQHSSPVGSSSQVHHENRRQPTQQHPSGGHVGHIMVSSSSSASPPPPFQPQSAPPPPNVTTTISSSRRQIQVNTADQMIVTDNLTIVHHPSTGTPPTNSTSNRDTIDTQRRRRSSLLSTPREGANSEILDLLQGDLLFESSGDEDGNG